MPNSETPMTAARIAALYRFGDRVGRKFVRGNQTMADLVDGLTPPIPAGTCEDLTSSRAMFALSPFPAPLPAGVTISNAPGAPAGGAGDSSAAAAIAALASAITPAGSVAAAPAAASVAGSGAPAGAPGGGAWWPFGAAPGGGGWPGGGGNPSASSSTPASGDGGPGGAGGPGGPGGPGALANYRERRRRALYSMRGYSRRYPYGAIVDDLSATDVPGWACLPSAALATSGAPAAAASTAAASGAVLWAVLLGLGLYFAIAAPNGGGKAQ